jgi:hypothetical protein
VPSISVPLNQVACPCARACADCGTFFAANQRSACRSRDATHNSPFGSTMMMTSVPPLNGEASAGECPEEQGDAQEHHDYAFA